MVHLVFSGGSQLAFYELGVMIEYKPEQIDSIYGTSAGCITGLVTILSKFNSWEDIETYFIKRPWIDIFKIMPKKIVDIQNTKGIYSSKLLCDMLNPLLNTIQCSMENTTLKHLYDITKIPFYIYTTRLTDFKCIELSYKSHPDLTLEKAITMSCSIPFIFEPVYHDNDFYIDGGFYMNYPLKPCISRLQHSLKDCSHNNISETEHNVVGVKFNDPDNKKTIKKDDTLFKYIYFLTTKIINSIKCDDLSLDMIPKNINYREILINDPEGVTLTNMKKTVVDESFRKYMIETGKNYFNDVCKNSTRLS